MEEKDLQRVEDTWEELGFRVRPLRGVVMVRTYPLPEKTESGLHLPPKSQSFYGELPHVSFVAATVLSSGPDAILEPGDRIGFKRLFFARWMDMADRTLVGWIQDERNVLGLIEGEIKYVSMGANTQPAAKKGQGRRFVGVLGGQ